MAKRWLICGDDEGGPPIVAEFEKVPQGEGLMSLVLFLNLFAFFLQGQPLI